MVRRNLLLIIHIIFNQQFNIIIYISISYVRATDCYLMNSIVKRAPGY